MIAQGPISEKRLVDRLPKNRGTLPRPDQDQMTELGAVNGARSFQVMASTECA